MKRNENVFLYFFLQILFNYQYVFHLKAIKNVDKIKKDFLFSSYDHSGRHQ